MKLEKISLDLVIEFPKEEIKIRNFNNFSKDLIKGLREIKGLKLNKEKGTILELESDSFKFLVTPIGIMTRLKEKYSIETVFVELESLLNSITKAITKIKKNASCGIEIRVVYRGDFSGIMNKVILKDKFEIAQNKISINSFIIDLKDKAECPFNIEVYKDKAIINRQFCIGATKICKKEICLPEDATVVDKIQMAKKVIEGLL